jgi:hypothetical protein
VLASKPVLKPRHGYYGEAQDEHSSDSVHSAPQFPSNNEVLFAVLAGEKCADRLLLFVGAAASPPREEEECAAATVLAGDGVDEDSSDDGEDSRDDVYDDGGRVRDHRGVDEDGDRSEDHSDIDENEQMSSNSSHEAKLHEQSRTSDGTFIRSLELECTAFSDLSDSAVLELVGGVAGPSRNPTDSRLMEANNFLRRRQRQNYSSHVGGARARFKTAANWTVWRFGSEEKTFVRLWDVVQMQTVKVSDAGWNVKRAQYFVISISLLGARHYWNERADLPTANRADGRFVCLPCETTFEGGGNSHTCSIKLTKGVPLTGKRLTSGILAVLKVGSFVHSRREKPDELQALGLTKLDTGDVKLSFDETRSGGEMNNVDSFIPQDRLTVGAVLHGVPQAVEPSVPAMLTGSTRSAQKLSRMSALWKKFARNGNGERAKHIKLLNKDELEVLLKSSGWWVTSGKKAELLHTLTVSLVMELARRDSQ